MTVAVVIPTVPGREQDLDRCLTAYEQTTPDAKFFVLEGLDSCGAGWVAGAHRAEAVGFDYLHFSADDLEPQSGWLEAAIEAVGEGFVPAPLVFTPDGNLDSAGLQNLGQYRGEYTDWQLIQGTTIPFLTAEMWQAIRPALEETMSRIHYCTDLMVSDAAWQHGWKTVIRTPMRLTHHVASAGRNYGRVSGDTQQYLEWKAALCAS